MRTGLACLLVILSVSLLSVAPCYFSDSPDCACFNNMATWNPTGTWIQDIALDTVGTIVSCVVDGGKPFYQMRLGLGSTPRRDLGRGDPGSALRDWYEHVRP